jgi:hypothetical protein
MVVSKNEAAQALQEIAAAQQRTQTMLRYRATSPYFVLWGGIWLLANCTAQFDGALGGTTWRILALLGSILSVWLSIRSTKQQPVSTTTSTSKQSWQVGAVWLVILLYFIATFAVLPHLDAKQGNAYISLFWAFLYVLLGIWTGWRILAVGILTVASILIGYFMITTFYFLWMGVVTGGLLILGGLWLRKV